MFWILSLSWFWRWKEHPCPKVLTWGFGGCCRFRTGVWHLHLDLDMVTGFLYTHDPNFSCLPWFWRCKEHLCHLSPHLGLWRMLDVPDWGFYLDLGFDMVSGLWYTHDLNFGSIWILKVQRTSLSFKSSFGALEDAGATWLEFGILILIWIW